MTREGYFADAIRIHIEESIDSHTFSSKARVREIILILIGICRSLYFNGQRRMGGSSSRTRTDRGSSRAMP